MEQDKISISWNSLPWKKFQSKSFRLQRKIYQAKHNGDHKSFKRLQKLLIKSKSIYYLSVKEIANYYSNKGIFLSQKMKIRLADEISISFFKYKHSINIFKESLVFLSLEYLKDEVVAYIWKFILNSIPSQGFLTITKKSIQIVSKFLKIPKINNSYTLKFKEFLNIFNLNFLKEMQRTYLILKNRSNYKVNVFRLSKPTYSDSCVYRRFLYLLISELIFYAMKNVSLFRVLSTLNILKRNFNFL
jgi:uncharacterized membrane protein YbaN (DUF454 family)